MECENICFFLFVTTHVVCIEHALGKKNLF